MSELRSRTAGSSLSTETREDRARRDLSGIPNLGDLVDALDELGAIGISAKNVALRDYVVRQTRATLSLVAEFVAAKSGFDALPDDPEDEAFDLALFMGHAQRAAEAELALLALVDSESEARS